MTGSSNIAVVTSCHGSDLLGHCTSLVLELIRLVDDVKEYIVD